MIIQKVPFFALSAVPVIITFLTQQAGGGLVDFKILPLKCRLGNVFLSYAAYMGKMFWPQNLAAFYPYKACSFMFWQVAFCSLLMLGISFFVIRLGRNQKYLPVGWFLFVGTLIPVIGLVQVAWSSYADRYTYIPYIGLFIMIAWGIPELIAKWPYRKIALGMLMPIILTALGICTYRQVSHWVNSTALFSHANEVTQNNYMAYNNLGNAYDDLGRRADAIDAYKQAIRIKPDYAQAHYNLGLAYGNLGRCTDAIDAFKQAIKIKPDYAWAYCNLGFAYGKLGCWPEAIEAYKQAIRIKPDYAEAHKNLGLAYLAVGDKNSAQAEFNILKSLNSELANNLFKEINK
jgi:tetratricopeptide (TPR) repeat protein